MRFTHCLEDEPPCGPLAAEEAWLLVYNPLSYAYTAPFRIPVKEGYTYTVNGTEAQVLKSGTISNDEIAFQVNLTALGVVAVPLKRSVVLRLPAKPTEGTHGHANNLVVIRNKVQNERANVL